MKKTSQRYSLKETSYRYLFEQEEDDAADEIFGEDEEETAEEDEGADEEDKEGEETEE